MEYINLRCCYVTVACFTAAGAIQFSQLLGDSLKKKAISSNPDVKENGHVNEKTPQKASFDKAVVNGTPATEKKKRGKRPIVEEEKLVEEVPKSSKKKRNNADITA